MNKLLLPLVILSTGAIGATVLHRAAKQAQTTSSSQVGELKAVTNGLVDMNEAAISLRNEVSAKRSRFREALQHFSLSPELLTLLEADISKGHSTAWAELRGQLGIGWDSSEDYVLVSKQVLKQVNFPRLYGSGVADMACSMLAISPQEQSGIKSALTQARGLAWSQVKRTEPAGDIVAQYTIQADPAVEEGISNKFSADITETLGPQRAELFLDPAWRELRAPFAPEGPVTMTIRRSVVDGEAKLSCELRQGKTISTSDVRYANYPSSWFLTLFPGGWQTMAQREGFELPKSFPNQPTSH